MAKYILSVNEDWKYTRGFSRPFFVGKILVIHVVTTLVFIIAGIFFKQYLFAAFVFLFALSLVWLTRFGLRGVIERRHLQNRFWSEEIEIELLEKVYKVSIGLNKLTLAVADIARIGSRKDCYSLYHDCGLLLIIPKKALSIEEIELLENYKIRSNLKNSDRDKKYYNHMFTTRRST